MKTFLSLFVIILTITVIPAAAQEAGPDGSFSYTYPIRIPQGVNGIQPDVSLVYNSNAGNGMLGMGWSLSGLPVIARDGSYGIDFDADDHYVFSGQRLIYSDPAKNYPAKGGFGDGYFHTERESFIRIAAYDAYHTITGPIADIAYWVVRQKNGTKMYFGYTSSEHTTGTDGRIDAVGKDGKALLWALNRVEDVHGNYYTIEYAEDAVNGDYYPAKITWTKNEDDPLPRTATVEFYYETRGDSWNRYVPTLINMDSRLRWIVVKSDTNIIRTEGFINNLT